MRPKEGIAILPARSWTRRLSASMELRRWTYSSKLNSISSTHFFIYQTSICDFKAKFAYDSPVKSPLGSIQQHNKFPFHGQRKPHVSLCRALRNLLNLSPYYLIITVIISPWILIVNQSSGRRGGRPLSSFKRRGEEWRGRSKFPFELPFPFCRILSLSWPHFPLYEREFQAWSKSVGFSAAADRG
jgi:hypothetical protein